MKKKRVSKFLTGNVRLSVWFFDPFMPERITEYH